MEESDSIERSHFFFDYSGVIANFADENLPR